MNRYRYMKKAAAVLFFTALLLWLWVSGLWYLSELKEQCAYAGLYAEESAGGTDRETAEQIVAESRENDGGELTFWTSAGKDTISAAELGSSAEAGLIAVCGRSGVLFRDAGALDIVSRGQCLISTELAYQLFGNSGGKGLEVICAGKKYEVAGTVTYEEPLFLWEPEENEGILFDRAALYAGDANETQEAAVRFISQNNGWESLNYRILLTVLSAMAAVLLLTAGMIPAFWIEKRGRALGKLAAFVCLSAAVISAAAMIDIPPDMIPDKWSDFSFWASWKDGVEEDIMGLINVEKGVPDEKYFHIFLSGTGRLIAVFAGIAGAAAICGAKPKSVSEASAYADGNCE